MDDKKEDKAPEIKNISGFPKELEDLQEMWNSFYIDLIATRKSENSSWLCFGLVFKLSSQIFPYKTEIRYNLNDRLIIAHHCEKFSFDRFKIVLREIIQGTLTLDSLQFNIENVDSCHFIFERRPGWSREGLRDEEGWPAHIFRSYLHNWELINSLQEFDELLIMHEEPYTSIPELTRKYLHGIEIGGAMSGAIYGVIPSYFKLENFKLDETGTIDVDVESHMCINPSDLMISVIIYDESDNVLHSYIVPLDRTQYLRSKENFWIIKKHINNNLKGVSEARLKLSYKKSIVVYEDWTQVIARAVLLKIYIGQNIRKEGILQSELYGQEQIQRLLSRSLIRENHWYLNQFLTTDEGSEIGRTLVLERIKDKEKELQNKLRDIPQRALSFFVKRHISKKLVFSTEKPQWSNLWEDHIIADKHIWILWDGLLSILEALDLCVKTHDYVSTRGGELRYMCYVISPETQEFLVSHSIPLDFTQDQEDILRLFPVLMQASRILVSDDVDSVRQQCYELLKSHSITEKQIAGIVNDMNKINITSEYHGLLSEKMPFDILDLNRFKIYLEKNLVEPAINILLGKEGKIKEYDVKEHFLSLSKVKNEGGFLDAKERGEFYILISDLELQLREFIKEKLGKGWMKRIENEFPFIAKSWEEKSQRDKKWGIEPEKDLMKYADMGDYIQIIKKYSRMFSDGDDDLSRVVTNLETWYIHGRIPVMHVRTVDQQKYFTTKSTVEFLLEWMHRKRVAIVSFKR